MPGCSRCRKYRRKMTKFPTPHGADMLMRKQAINKGYIYRVAAANMCYYGDKTAETKMKDTILGSQLLIEHHPRAHSYLLISHL